MRKNADKMAEDGFKDLENLKKLNLVPNETIKEYNKKYYRLQESLDNIHASTIQKLTVEFKKYAEKNSIEKSFKMAKLKKPKY